MVQEHFAEIVELRPGRKLFLRHWSLGKGSTNKITLVCVHGTAATQEQFLPLLRSLETKLNDNECIDCWMYDAIGCGHTPKLEDSQAYQDTEQVQDLQAMMEKYVNLLDHPIYFLGHSYGPTWIFKWLQHPNSISIAGLILVSTGVRNSDLMAGGPLLFRALPLWLLRCLQPLLTQTFLKIGFAQLTHPELIQAAKESSNANDMQVVCFYYQAHDWLEDISSFQSLRTLVLHGAQDGVIPIRYGQVVAIQLNTKLIAVENASHMVLLEQPAEVAEQILLFWRNTS